MIATTVAPITSIASAVVGDRADVTGIVPEGTNSHTFEPRPSVAEVLSRADVVYMNGLRLEEPTEAGRGQPGRRPNWWSWATRRSPRTSTSTTSRFRRRAANPTPTCGPTRGWPEVTRRSSRTTCRERDPENADHYEENYRRFAEQIDELDQAMRSAFGTIPERKLLTYHDAYAYFAQTYDWEIIGAIQVSDFEDPSPGEVADLIEQVRDSGVPAIFGSEVFPSPVLERIGEEADVSYVDSLRDDDLPGEPGDPEHSWLGLMRFNFITMTDALGGDSSALEAWRSPRRRPTRPSTLLETRARPRRSPGAQADSVLARLDRVTCTYGRIAARRRRPADRRRVHRRPVGLGEDDAAESPCGA
ncbi:MAG: metal ABC transporter substrate-binding protein [Ilumatobacteraceae bacterium]